MSDQAAEAVKLEESPPAKIVFYCKKCKSIIAEPERQGKKYQYKCAKCKSSDVAFGTEKSIKNYYRIKD